MKKRRYKPVMEKPHAKLCEAFGPSGKRRFWRRLLGIEKPLWRLSIMDAKRLLGLIEQVPKEVYFKPGWEGLAVAEIKFGMSLAPVAKRLWHAKAMRLTRNLAGELTMIVHIERAAEALRLSPAWLDVQGLQTLYGYQISLPVMLRFLREAGTPERRVLRWDAITSCTFDHDYARKYLDSLKPGEHRPGVRRGRKIAEKMDKRMVGGWMIKSEIMEALGTEMHIPFWPQG